MSIQPLRSPLGAIVAAAALAVLISVGLLGGMTALFLSEGLPFEQAVIAERACGESAFLSDRQASVRAFLAATQRPAVASR